MQDGSGAGKTPGRGVHRWALRLITVALVTLAVWPSGGSSSSAAAPAVVDVGVSPTTLTGDQPSEPGAQVPTGSTGENSPPTVPFTIDRLWSPAPNTAQVEGTAHPSAPISVIIVAENVPVATASLDPDEQGKFTVVVEGLAPGAQTLCLDQVCSRVFVTDPEVEPTEAVEARIAQAIFLAGERFDVAAVLPGWTIEATGPNPGVPGYVDVTNRSVFITANPGVSLDDLTKTVLRQLGHAVDATYLDSDKRAAFRALRGHDPELPWGQPPDATRRDDQPLDSARDFAETFVVWVMDGNYQATSSPVAAQPTSAQLRAFCELIELPGEPCSS